ncbi:ACT domain-containing protein [Propioniciclava flava]
MAGMTDLHEILGALRPYVRQGAYVVVTTQTPPDVAYHARIVEDEGTTLVLDQAIADEYHLTYEGVFGWITLEAHTSLQAVGITAAAQQRSGPGGAVVQRARRVLPRSSARPARLRRGSPGRSRAGE